MTPARTRAAGRWRAGLRDALRPMRTPNYRRFLTGQCFSQIGIWMQITAQGWLVLGLTHSSAALGLIVALQTLPVLIVGAYGGLVVDRVERHRTLLLLQFLMAAQSLALAALTIAGVAEMWEIALLALALGSCAAVEGPCRAAFLHELVAPEDLGRAVSLNALMQNGTRTIGPALAGALIALLGDGPCFIANALGFMAVARALRHMDLTLLRAPAPIARGAGQLRQALGYVRARALLATPLAMMALVGTFAYEFQVSLPSMSRLAFAGDAETYGMMMAAIGIGSLVGGVISAARAEPTLPAVTASCALFALGLGLGALAPSLPLELAALTIVGVANLTFVAGASSLLQLNTAPDMQGRVMSLWFVAFQGSTPIGGPLVGLTIVLAGARSGLALGAGACLLAALLGVLVESVRRSRVPEQPVGCTVADGLGAGTTGPAGR